jgi:hypothetical protein
MSGGYGSRRWEHRPSVGNGQCQDTLGALAPFSGFLPARSARRPSAAHDAWRVTRLNQVHQAPRGRSGEDSPLIYKEHPEGKK